MANLIDSTTLENLITSFANESMARNRYEYYAKVAKKEGFVEIYKMLEDIADQERVHAKMFYGFLNEAKSDLKYNFEMSPTNLTRDTLDNLEIASKGEREEWEAIYPKFESIAKEEGFPKIAAIFHTIAVAEKYHNERIDAMIGRLKQDQIFKSSESIRWHCQKCGFIYEGKEPLKICPACMHPKAHFQKI